DRPRPLADRRFGHDRAPRSPLPERARRDRAGQAPHRDPDREAPGGGRPDRAHQGSAGRPRLDPHRHRRGPRPAQAPARAQDGLPCQAPRRARRRGPPHARTRRGAAGGDARMTEALGRSFASLSIPNFRRYFTGQLVSLSGNWMQMIAELWVVLSLTGSGVAVGLTTALQFLPMLIFGAWGGLIADRVPKRRLLLLTQALHMIAPLAMLALALEGVLVPWMVFCLVFLRG